MSDFQKYLAEQLKDPEFRQLWEARKERIVRQTAGSMALSGLDLTEEDKDRIRYLIDHPDEMDAMLEELIQKHTVRKQKALSFVEVLHLKNEAVTICHTEKGTWKDRARPVQSFMNMNHLPLESGVILDLDDFGKVWTAYLKEGEHEVRL